MCEMESKERFLQIVGIVSGLFSQCSALRFPKLTDLFVTIFGREELFSFTYIDLNSGFASVSLYKVYGITS